MTPRRQVQTLEKIDWASMPRRQRYGFAPAKAWTRDSSAASSLAGPE